jgi:hypothetical protein
VITSLHQLTLASAVLRDDYRQSLLKVEDVTQYSFGQDENGKPVVWAAGKAGWYEIIPSVRYQAYFSDTIEAIDLFYFICDQHQKLPLRRQKRGFQIDPFLAEYQRHTNYRIDDNDEAMEALHKHHKFLLKQMYEEREGIDWSRTHLWKHLAPTYPEEVEMLVKNKMKVEQQEVEVDGAEEGSEQGSEEEEEEEEEEEGGEDEGEGEEEEEEEEEEEDNKEHDAVVSSDDEAELEEKSPSPEQEDKDWTQTIWEILAGLRISGNISLRHCTIDKLAEQLQEHPEFPGDHEAAITSIEKSAEPLLTLMNQAKLKKKFNWTTRPIYAELEAILADQVAEIKTPAQNPDKRHRQKSVLRPSGHGSKANKRAREIEDSEEDGEELPVSTPGARTPVHRRIRAPSVSDDDDATPSRQLNGDIDALPILPPPPETQEMLDLVKKEAKAVGRQKQVSHLEAFLGSNWAF